MSWRSVFGRPSNGLQALFHLHSWEGELVNIAELHVMLFLQLILFMKRSSEWVYVSISLLVELHFEALKWPEWLLYTQPEIVVEVLIKVDLQGEVMKYQVILTTTLLYIPGNYETMEICQGILLCYFSQQQSILGD